MRSPAEYEIVGSDSYPINATYAATTGATLTAYKKGVVCQIKLTALKTLPYHQDVTILSPMGDKYKPITGFSTQIYDSNNPGFVVMSLNLDGSLHAYSNIQNPTALHNLGVGNLIYITKN